MANKKEKIRCEGKTFDGWKHYQCMNNSNSIVDGKHYCGKHNPIKIEEKRKIKDKIWEDKYNYEQEKKEYQIKAVEYCKKKNLTIQDLKDALVSGDKQISNHKRKFKNELKGCQNER